MAVRIRALSIGLAAACAPSVAARGLGLLRSPTAARRRQATRASSPCAFCSFGAAPSSSEVGLRVGGIDAPGRSRAAQSPSAGGADGWPRPTPLTTFSMRSCSTPRHNRSSRQFASSSEGSAAIEDCGASAMPPSVGTGSRVCVVEPEDGSAFAPDARGELGLLDLARNLAEDLSLPLMEAIGGREDGDDDNGDGNESADRSSCEECTHCLRILPYEYGPAVRSYALAIQPLPGADGDDAGGRSRRRKRRRRRKPDEASSVKPFFVDFVPPVGSKMDRRLGKNHGGGSELLVKAVGPGKIEGGAVVYDLTAGFGQDASIVAAAGGASEVRMVERDPVVAALLGDALRRLRLVAQTEGEFSGTRAAELAARLTLEVGEGADVANRVAADVEDERGGSSSSSDGNGAIRPDVCYLDPMFPPRTKSAAVKKNMQILHSLLQSNARPNDGEKEEKDEVDRCSEGPDRSRLEAERSLLESSLRAARVRVVVKRPIQAPPLGDDGNGVQKPSYSVRGSVNRWDVYVK